jgi:hypothetical protein
VSVACGSMLSSVVCFTSGIGGWVSFSPCLRPNTSHQLLLLRFPPSVVFECCWMCGPWGVGLQVSFFPLLVVVVALGRLSGGSFSSSPSRVTCCISIG